MVVPTIHSPPLIRHDEYRLCPILAPQTLEPLGSAEVIRPCCGYQLLRKTLTPGSSERLGGVEHGVDDLPKTKYVILSNASQNCILVVANQRGRRKHANVL